MSDTLFLSEALEEFLEEKTLGPEKIAIKTQVTYKRIVKYLIEVCGDRPINEYTSRDYKKLHSYLEKKTKDNPFPEKDRFDGDGKKMSKKEKRQLFHNTIAGYYSYLHHFFNHFSKMVAENPVTLSKTQDKLPEAIPEDDLQLILEKLKPDPDQYNIINFLLWSGFRSNEACQLDCSQVNMETRIMVFENFKGRVKYDYYPIHEELFQHLTNLGPKKKGKIFPYSGPDQVSNIFDSAQKGLEVRKHYTVHQLRKTFASRCVNSGMDPFVLMKLLRHKSITTTLKYYAEADLQRIGKVIDQKVKIKGKETENEKADQ